jgi:hypothetical protein
VIERRGGTTGITEQEHVKRVKRSLDNEDISLEDLDEYVVEKILDHIKVKNALWYHVKMARPRRHA